MLETGNFKVQMCSYADKTGKELGKTSAKEIKAKVLYWPPALRTDAVSFCMLADAWFFVKI